MGAGHILLVDDETPLRVTLAANLELEGFEVSEASNGTQALALASSRHFDLVLSDIRMPGMSGVELFRALRAQGQEMPVVLMTAFAREELVDRALEEGAFAVLSKPFDVPLALNALKSAARRPDVLVVDDSEFMAELISEALEQAGLDARPAQHCEEALEIVRRGESDVCVVDLVMPEMTGAQLAQRARALDPTLAIIAVSGHDVPELLRQVATVGVHAFLRKPFAMRDLVRAIARARAERALGPQARAVAR
jgi:DNA-binding NtrC family response regulator